MKGVDIDAALLEFGGAVARFRSLAHGARRPQRSRWRKWWLCWQRISEREHEGMVAWHGWYLTQGVDFLADMQSSERRTYCARTKAAKRYRRMLWGRKPFGKGQG